jgi:hypothetical protein
MSFAGNRFARAYVRLGRIVKIIGCSDGARSTEWQTGGREVVPVEMEAGAKLFAEEQIFSGQRGSRAQAEAE